MEIQSPIDLQGFPVGFRQWPMRPGTRHCGQGCAEGTSWARSIELVHDAGAGEATGFRFERDPREHSRADGAEARVFHTEPFRRMWETRLGAWKVLWHVGKALWEGYAGGSIQSTRSIQLSTGPVQVE